MKFYVKFLTIFSPGLLPVLVSIWYWSWNVTDFGFLNLSQTFSSGVPCKISAGDNACISRGDLFVIYFRIFPGFFLQLFKEFIAMMLLRFVLHICSKLFIPNALRRIHIGNCPQIMFAAFGISLTVAFGALAVSFQGVSLGMSPRITNAILCKKYPGELSEVIDVHGKFRKDLLEISREKLRKKTFEKLGHDKSAGSNPEGIEIKEI